MLQQTRVAAVLPYYRGFLRRLPTLRALARARTEQVLRLWAGLGYYSRARNLHRAAKQIVARHDGRFPRELNAALQLPGIGRYTAAAVLSIAYGAPYAVLDGNVARVLARLSALRGNLRTPQRWKRLQNTAQDLLASEAPGNWNQAMMELGATVCTPHAPRCDACPVSRWCQAYHLGIAEELPLPREKRAPVSIRLAAAILLDPRGRTLVLKNRDGDDGALFSRMWQFPAVRVSRRAEAELSRHLRALFGPAFLNGEVGIMPLPTARHTVTFREITLSPFLVQVDHLPRIEGARNPGLAQLDRLPISNATRKIAAAARRFA
jgi:A/G-specific adenine glycosylase